MSNPCLFIGSKLFFGGSSLWSNSGPRMVRAEWLNFLEKSDSGSVFYFDVEVSDWDEEDGLIYTDDAWLASLRVRLIEQGFSPEVVALIDYTEQGAQRYDYVHLCCDHPDFMSEFLLASMKICFS